MRRLAPVILAVLTACAGADDPDAYGNFEAEEVVLAAETAGPILSLAVTEGATVAQGAVIAVVDSLPLALEREQLAAQRGVLQARAREVAAQLDALGVQLEIAERSLGRTTRLREGDAATAAQFDNAEREVRVLRAQRVAAEAGRASIAAELRALDARLATVDDRRRRTTIRSPIDGTVLATYVRAGETIQPGQPVAAIADLRQLTLRAYVTGDQLASFRLGQAVTVTADGDGARFELPGTITWVSSRAEFTPTPVQTRRERAELVYAIKVRVEDAEGRLKIGMPGDLRFGGRNADVDR